MQTSPLLSVFLKIKLDRNVSYLRLDDFAGQQTGLIYWTLEPMDNCNLFVSEQPKFVQNISIEKY